VEIKPFRAYRYDAAVVGDVGNCVAPPYDVISPAEQESLYRKSEYNIVRIIKGKTDPSDNERNNQYTRAAEYLNTWIEKGVLKKDSVDSIYAYIQDFQVDGQDLQRLSFIALGKLEEFGNAVRPHENILSEPIADRLNLKRATSARFGLPLMLYEDPSGVADKIIAKAAQQKPLVEFRNDDNVRHRLFAITDAAEIGVIVDLMRDKVCIIADGHHRYTTGLAYSRENPNPEARYQMLAFVNVCHKGMVILATHRLVGNLNDFEPSKFIKGLEADFELTRYGFDSEQTKLQARQKAMTKMKQQHREGKNAIGLYFSDGAFYAAVLKNHQAMISAAPEKSEAWRSLDVAVLHKLILEKRLGIGEPQLTAGTNVEYLVDLGDAVDRAIRLIDSGQKQLLFLLNPTKWQQIRSVTEAGERMPQKSTYFYPKIYTGLTINKL